MKPKNLILGALALVFTLGSTFTSFSTKPISHAAYVEVKQTAGQSQFTCEQVSLPDGTCNGNTITDCIVGITLLSGSDEAVVAHSDSGCVNNFKDNSLNTETFDIDHVWDPFDVQD